MKFGQGKELFEPFEVEMFLIRDKKFLWYFSLKAKLVRNSHQRMLKMAPLSFCSFMVVTQPKFQTSLGMLMNLGYSAVSQRTTSCKCGRWLKTFIMTRNLTPQLLSLSQGHHEISCENSLIAGVSSVKIFLALFFVTLFLNEAEFLSHVRVCCFFRGIT